VIPTNEELMIARHTGMLLGLAAARSQRAQSAEMVRDAEKHHTLPVSERDCGAYKKTGKRS
jgi:hypothetical protein